MSKFSIIEEEINAEEESLAKERQQLKEKENHIIREKVVLRKQTLKKQYDIFITAQNKNTQDSVYLNSVLLKSAITSYYIDIHRYKDFSGSAWANKHKQAAYTIKWLVRFRPIQTKEITEYLSEEIFEINLKFALVCGFAFLDKKVIDLIMQNKQKVDLINKTKDEDKKENSFYDKLLYDLRYRQLSGKKLILVFEALELICD
jgi:hypothetical protein